MKRWMILLSLLAVLPACALSDRGVARLQVEDELILGSSLDEIRDHWYWYSKKPLQLDPLAAEKNTLSYRGISHDPGVTSFYLYFNIKNKTLKQAEWRFRPSLTEIKSKELVAYWTKKLWAPSIEHNWGSKIYVWADRKAKLELVIGDGICHLRHRLR